ncbi:MAG: rhamnogalacturonan acetylesterase [Bacteroidota bacterium]|nr:rhamnogalacturonan acetylesterase [Bacteroidota bacterium]
MKRFKSIALFLIVAGLLTGMVAEKKRPVKVFLAGDSTCANYALEDDYQTKRFPITGWGQVFQQFFRKDSLKMVAGLIKADSVIVYDRAKGGRSTRTFFQEGRWRAIYSEMQAGDLVIISFGHNDAAKDKTERYVDIDGYKEFLRLYVSQTRQKDGIPVLMTPVNRNYSWEDGVLKNCHGEYPQAVKDIAAEMNVLLIDLTELSCDFFTKKGQEYVTPNYFMNLPANTYQAYPDGQKDNTHFQPEGAQAVAQLVFDGLKKLKKEN